MPFPRRFARFTAALVAAALLAASCGSDSNDATPTTSTPDSATTTQPSTPDGGTPTTTVQPTTTTIPVPVFIDENGFNDHTVRTVASVDEFRALARSADGRGVVKFSLADLFGDTEVRWADSNFFELHDEWYWFRLLNGQPIPALDDRPLTGLTFDTIADIYEWAERLDTLPLNMRWVESQTFGRNRLYSDRFYEVVLHAEPRSYAVGSLIEFPTAEGVHWLIELEYSDIPTAAEIEAIFDRLAPTLPPEIGDNLEWVLRSPEQEELAAQLVAAELPYHDRTVRYRDLMPPGEVTVYNDGIAAGRLLLVDDAGTQLALASDTDILVMEHVPDWLPPASALITSNPQTPLAHVNLLARNRGIPNVSLAGATENASLQQAARVRARVIVRAADGGLEIEIITRNEYNTWLDMLDQPPIAVPDVDPTAIATTIELGDLAETISSDNDIEPWRPIIGGKAAGFLTLLAADVTVPHSPLALTVAPYLRHLEQVDDTLGVMRRNGEFATDSRARFLLLEGPEDYFQAYTSTRDVEYAEELLTGHPPGTVLGEVLAADGFKKFFRGHEMDPDDLATITDALEDSFGDYESAQGLRFRSSSSVEDIEGFSGAGLYDSNTGYLDTTAGRSVEDAILKTWASYWGFEAYEERRRENVDHLSGAMGVLVHARFDDPLEVNNGVATVTLLPSPGAGAEVVINTQLGAVSVTNPDPASSDTPEEIFVLVEDDGGSDIDRVRPSSLSDTPLLSDNAVDELVGALLEVAELWRLRINRDLAGAQQIEVVTLDFEFKTMAAGWPAIDGEPDLPGRLVIKQARSLDPGLRGISAQLLAAPVPRDVLARALLVERYDCGADTVWVVTTDPLSAPPMGFDTDPLVAPAGASVEGCGRRVLLRTPDQYLLELLDGSGGLSLTG